MMLPYLRVNGEVGFLFQKFGNFFMDVNLMFVNKSGLNL